MAQPEIIEAVLHTKILAICNAFQKSGGFMHLRLHSRDCELEKSSDLICACE